MGDYRQVSTGSPPRESNKSRSNKKTGPPPSNSTPFTLLFSIYSIELAVRSVKEKSHGDDGGVQSVSIILIQWVGGNQDIAN
jgi:hypothetical protein